VVHPGEGRPPATTHLSIFLFRKEHTMSTIVELPLRIEESDTAGTLDDLLGTLKVTYTVTACSKCGRMVMLTELTAPVEREAALA
jgi:hypothetical protein